MCFGVFDNSEPIPDEPLLQVERLKSILVAYATGARAVGEDYPELRRRLLDNPSLRSRLPKWLTTHRTLQEFWGFIKQKFNHYHERREFLQHEFDPALTFLEFGGGTPVESDSRAVLVLVDSEHVQTAWDRAISRRDSDPEGAITAAKALVETVCKHILSELKGGEWDSLELPALYHEASKVLNLAPSQHSEEAFKKILGGCSTVVNSLANIRNRDGDAHGKGPQAVRPLPRHARLVVNLAGSMALFLIETFEARRIASAPPIRNGSDQ